MDPCELMFPASYPDLKDCTNLLIIGSKGTCKTSLLFQIANSLSHQCNDDTVSYICPNKLTDPPLHVHRMPRLTASTAKNISIQYQKTYHDLVNHIAGLFLHTKSLRGILIDGIDLFMKTLDEYKDGNYKECLTKLFALLVDTGGYYSNFDDDANTGSLGKRGHCPVVVTFDCNPEDVTEMVTVESIGSHFFDAVMKCDQCNNLESSQAFKLVDGSDNRIYFYVKNGEIFLDRIAKG